MAPGIATVRAKIQEALEPDPRRTGTVETVSPILDGAQVRTLITGRESETAAGAPAIHWECHRPDRLKRLRESTARP
jgi:hypothetical protein